MNACMQDNIFALSTSFTRVRAPSAALPAATATLRWRGPATLKSSAKFAQSPQTLVKWTRLSQKFVGANLRGNGKSIAAVTLNGMQATIGAPSDGKIKIVLLAGNCSIYRKLYVVREPDGCSSACISALESRTPIFVSAGILRMQQWRRWWTSALNAPLGLPFEYRLCSRG